MITFPFVSTKHIERHLYMVRRKGSVRSVPIVINSYVKTLSQHTKMMAKKEGHL